MVQLEEAKKKKQAALDKALADGDMSQRNLLKQRQIDQLDSSLEKLKMNMAREALRAGKSSYYPTLTPSVPSMTWGEQAHAAEADDSYLTNEHKKRMRLVGLLPDDFPIDRFDSMTPNQQNAAVSRTNLSKEEQWALLNAGKDIKPLSEIMDIPANRYLYGLSQPQSDEICRQLVMIDDIRISANNGEIQFSSERQKNMYLQFLDEKEQQILASIVSRTAGKWDLAVGKWVGRDSVDLTDDLSSLMRQKADSFSLYCYQNSEKPGKILTHFINLSKTNGELDIKNKQDWRFIPEVDYYFDGMELRSDDVGNILFGYVGATEYPLWFLQMGAGAYQVKSGTSDWAFYDSYYDDPRDSDMIEYGYNLYCQEHSQ